MSIFTALILAALTFGSCSARHFEGNIFSKNDMKYRVGKLDKTWTQVEISGADLAFYNSKKGATMVVNATCDGGNDAPLDMLTKHLVFGFTSRQFIEEKTIEVDGRGALLTHFLGKIDGVLVEMHILVLKKNNCVFDLVYSAAPGSFSGSGEFFENFVLAFQYPPKE